MIERSGVTAHASAIPDQICAVLIDHEGKIRPAGAPTVDGGRVVGRIVSLLKKSVAHDVKPVSLETPRLPDGAYKAADFTGLNSVA
jgi:hypothetical protein